MHFHAGLVQGKTVVIDFIFTSCTIICRPLTGNLRKVRSHLDPETLKDVRFVSVSVDPAHDTPAALSSFARAFGVPADWAFVTGSQADIDQIVKAAGVYTTEPGYHTARVIVGSDAAGWSRLYGLAPPAALAQAIREAVGRRKEKTHE